MAILLQSITSLWAPVVTKRKEGLGFRALRVPYCTQGIAESLRGAAPSLQSRGAVSYSKLENQIN